MYPSFLTLPHFSLPAHLYLSFSIFLTFFIGLKVRIGDPGKTSVRSFEVRALDSPPLSLKVSLFIIFAIALVLAAGGGALMRFYPPWRIDHFLVCKHFPFLFFANLSFPSICRLLSSFSLPFSLANSFSFFHIFFHKNLPEISCCKLYSWILYFLKW